MEGCIFHNKRWRGKTQRLLNTLRTSTFSGVHIKYFAKAVCVCQDGDDRSVKMADLPVLKEWIKTVSINSEMRLLHPLLADMLTEVKCNSSPFTASLLRALSVVRAACQGDYSPLTPLSRMNDPPYKSPLPTMTFDLGITSTNLGVYFGRSGSSINQISKQYNVRIHVGPVGGRTDGHVSYLRGDKFEVTLIGERRDSLSIVREKMLRRAQLVTERRDKHTQHVLAYYKRKKNMIFSGSEKSSQSVSTAKEAAMEQFEKKQYHKKQRGAYPGKRAVLSDGHCLNCLGDYQNGETMKEVCCCHPGYLVPFPVTSSECHKTEWSCCQLPSVEQHPTHEAHSNTGCSTGRHVWRPGKSGKNGPTKIIPPEHDFIVH